MTRSRSARAEDWEQAATWPLRSDFTLDGRRRKAAELDRILRSAALQADRGQREPGSGEGADGIEPPRA